MIDSVMLQFLQECAPTVAPQTMRAILHVESAARPFVIGYKVVDATRNVYQLARQPSTKEEAISWAQWLLDNGYKFDAGWAQINSQHFNRLGLTSQTVFDPCVNLRAGSTILTEEYLRAAKKYGVGQQALLAAISAYNSGNYITGFKNGYVGKVVRAAMRGGPPMQLYQNTITKVSRTRETGLRKVTEATDSGLDIKNYD